MKGDEPDASEADASEPGATEAGSSVAVAIAPATDVDPLRAAPAIEQGASTIEPVAEPERAGVPRKVPLWGAIVGVIAGGIAAQVLGMMALIVAAVITLANGGGAFDLGPELLSNFAVIAPSVATTGLVLGATPFIVVLLARAPVRASLGLRAAPLVTYVAGALGVLAVGPTSDLFLRLMQENLPMLSFGALEGIDTIATSAPVPLTVFFLAVIPGLCEELLFRGLLQRAIDRRGVALVVSAVVFACYHMDPHHVVAVLPAGFYLAWLGMRTATVTVPIAAHVTNNAAAVMARAYLPEDTIHHAVGWEDLGAAAGGWLAVAVLAAAVHWSMTRAERAEKERGPAAF